MKLTQFNTKLGPMIAIADEYVLHLLEFIGRRGLELEIEQLKLKTKSNITAGMTIPLISIQQELDLYFAGDLKEFKTPIVFSGTTFQQRVWEQLQKIPYGETRSYAEIATAIGQPTAFRAAANANGCNQLAIIIPCHRVINSNGKLGGYGGGIENKRWLLNHEKAGNKKW